ncbi:hypothetical protein [Streptomyces hypolithicus]
MTAVLTVAAFAVGAFAGWGGMDIGETCGDSYDEVVREEHLNDSLFPLHNWCNAERDLVPSWVNPTVAGLGVVSAVCGLRSAVCGLRSAVCLIMTVALALARAIRKSTAVAIRG